MIKTFQEGRVVFQEKPLPNPGDILIIQGNPYSRILVHNNQERMKERLEETACLGACLEEYCDDCGHCDTVDFTEVGTVLNNLATKFAELVETEMGGDLFYIGH